MPKHAAGIYGLARGRPALNELQSEVTTVRQTMELWRSKLRRPPKLSEFLRREDEGDVRRSLHPFAFLPSLPFGE